MALPLEDYGMIGDLHTAALVGRDGSIDWLCLPRFDSPACFAALLGDERNGFWRLAPAAGGTCRERRYRDDTLILESEWTTPEGRVRVTDAMTPRSGSADVVRVVEGLEGRVPMRTSMRLRFGYGRYEPWIRCDDGQFGAVAGPDAAWLSTEVRLEVEDATAYADFAVSAGEQVSFVLTHVASHLPRPEPLGAAKGLDDTEEYWHSWISRFDYEGQWKGPVRRSLLTLKALTYAPTGGIVAAPTTSLPEQLGGVRNWDYRFCWLRDATFTLQALLGTGYIEEAREWREWLLRAVAGDPAELQILYGLDGTRRIPEYTVEWLSGYEGSSPVRVGNLASHQFQLDVWGEVLDGLHLAREAGLGIDESAWDLQRALLEYLEGHWTSPDQSLWEVRAERRHFVHSKVMAWAGFNCAVRAVEKFGLEGPVERWKAIREEIHREICDRGFDPDRGTFTQFYGSQGLDASLLLIPQVGFLPWSDERVVGTVEAIQRELCRDGFALRYDPVADGGVDGLPGHEGSFLACTFWLVDALHGIGRGDQAVELFEKLLGVRNDLGLLAEEYDHHAQRLLGNFPQAYSHVGLVNSARHLSGSHPATKNPEAERH
ncbi:glycoside hydrolase family 15 protein [Glycomyces halotolerans]